MQALCGDASTTCPASPASGSKTAAELINTYGDVETLLGPRREIKQPKRREKLIENADLARISQAPRDPEPQKCRSSCRSRPWRASRSSRRALPVPQGDGVLRHHQAPRRPADRPIRGLVEADPELAAKPAAPVGFDNAARAEARAAPPGGRRARRCRPRAPMPPPSHEMTAPSRSTPTPTRSSATPRRCSAGSSAIYPTGIVATDTETTGLDNQTADLVGISFSTAPGNGAYLPLGHAGGEATSSAAATPRARWTSARRSTC